MLCDNEAVYKNALTPESKLKKKKISIFYRKCREAVSDGVIWIAKYGKATKLADLFTQMLVQIRSETLLHKFTY